MYLGQIVEIGTWDHIYNNPRHPYTQALISAMPEIKAVDRRERIILEGEVPSPIDPPPLVFGSVRDATRRNPVAPNRCPNLHCRRKGIVVPASMLSLFVAERFFPLHNKR